MVLQYLCYVTVVQYYYGMWYCTTWCNFVVPVSHQQHAGQYGSMLLCYCSTTLLWYVVLYYMMQFCGTCVTSAACRAVWYYVAMLLQYVVCGTVLHVVPVSHQQHAGQYGRGLPSGSRTQQVERRNDSPLGQDQSGWSDLMITMVRWWSCGVKSSQRTGWAPCEWLDIFTQSITHITPNTRSTDDTIPRRSPNKQNEPINIQNSNPEIASSQN